MHSVLRERVGEFLPEFPSHASDHIRFPARFGDCDRLICALSARIGHKPFTRERLARLWNAGCADNQVHIQTSDDVNAHIFSLQIQLNRFIKTF